MANGKQRIEGRAEPRPLTAGDAPGNLNAELEDRIANAGERFGLSGDGDVQGVNLEHQDKALDSVHVIDLRYRWGCNTHPV